MAVLVAGAIAVALFVPVRERTAGGRRAEPTRAEREQAAAQVRQTADAIQQSLRDAKVDPATARQLEALRDLERELTEGQRGSQGRLGPGGQADG
jgi:hypothetical protein